MNFLSLSAFLSILYDKIEPLQTNFQTLSLSLTAGVATNISSKLEIFHSIIGVDQFS